ncbi:hypothetical protein Q7C36_013881 [Tachysurus vachellii]|uniref:Pre-mRNA-splicing factor SLU7 n=1 Tax=Tachysurus vachellii TaxID=175792 RepID=A0AA88MLG0_TACVA|nr:hypothetical protein Q7C36_013881 [Tachysurus vachellii]
MLLLRDINPHIPQYISSVPWYIDPSKRPTLKHQRPQEEKQLEFSSIGEWYKRGVQEQSVSTKFRKGACENCGALTHKKKDCLERPRKVRVKFSGTGFAPDEVAKRTLKAQRLQEELATGKLDHGEREHNSEDEDEDKYADDIDMPGQNFDSKRRITVRNLRIREDTAKSLRGRRTRRERRSTCRQTRPSWSCSISPSESKRKTSKINRKRASWISTEVRNISTLLHKSCCSLRPRITWSTLDTERSSKARRKPSHALNTKRTSLLITTAVSGARIGKTAAGVLSAATRWSNRATAPETPARKPQTRHASRSKKGPKRNTRGRQRLF